MKITGVIAEFNPFHNGHRYLIEKIKENSNAVVCVMSGSFVQRGDVAIYDKWTRAKASVLCGADLVIELPAIFATASAERFASGATVLLESLGCIDEITFGSECGNIELLYDTAKKLNNESEEISGKIKRYLSAGMGYPAALQAAHGGDATLQNPNDILAIEYIKASLKRNSEISFSTISRKEVNHSDIVLKNGFASASAIRQMIKAGNSYEEAIPDELHEIYKNADTYDISRLSDTVLYLLRTTSADELAQLSDVSEGLENRLKSAAGEYNDIEMLVNAVSTKRYTSARIRRILTSLLLGITKEMPFLSADYIRILAFNSVGSEILKKIKSKSSLPIVTKTADFKKESILFQKDILATDIAALCASSPENRYSGKDFLNSPIYVH